MTTSNQPLRHVVIGVGAGIFDTHRQAMETVGAEVVAVADVNPETGQPQAEALGCPFYTDHRAMLAAVDADVAVIVTPHPFHASLAVDCFQAGLHVLVEKPIAVTVAEADAMIEAAEKADRLLAVNYQMRHSGPVRTAHKLIQEGRLGKIQRIDMAQTWTRTASYYRFAGWRGTWKGEGGGVLMNQAPHNLDLICHLIGLPRRVFAWTRTILHDIKTEDTVQAMMEWPDGVLGSLHISTAEAGQPSRIEILGTGGVLQLSGRGLTFQQFEPELREHIAHSDQMYSGPAVHETELELESGEGRHPEVYRNLHAAIREGAPLAADGVEGRKSLELANAMIYSSYSNNPVDLPLDRAQYTALLEDLKAKE